MPELSENKTEDKIAKKISVWDNDAVGLAETIQNEDPDGHTSFDDALEQAYEEINESLESERDILSRRYLNGYVMMGTLQRWNGPKQAYRHLDVETIGDAVFAAVSAFTSEGDVSLDVYVDTDEHKLIITQLGHDNPTNPSIFEIRALTKNWDEIENSEEDIGANSASIGDEVLKTYGFIKE